MQNLVEFLFSNFWVWLGGLIYLTVIAFALSSFRPFNFSKKKYNFKDKEEKE